MTKTQQRAARLRRPQAEGLRQAMAWLHTWAGLIVGWLLFAMFLSGTLAFFRPEITRWMQPEMQTQSAPIAQSVAVAQRYLSVHAADATRWFITLPNEREPWVQLGYPVAKPAPGERAFRRILLDPHTGLTLAARPTRGGDFFYRFHFELEMRFPWGRWLASVAAMFMLVAIISGVITHKKIFTDFFTFRPRKGGQRAWMDGHNVLSVLGLPFHLMISFSGLVLLMAMLMPAGIMAAYDNERTYFDELFPSFALTPRQNVAASLTALAPLAQVAQRLWPDGTVGRLVVSHPGDAGAVVTFSRAIADRVSYGRLTPTASFNGVSGELLSDRKPESGVATIAGTLVGLHLGHFAQPLLRWLYFLIGLAGTAMVGTGLTLWVVKRRQKLPLGHPDTLSLRVVEALNAGTMCGVMLGVAVFFLANRLLPLDLLQRELWESRSFFIAWSAGAGYAFFCPRNKWRDLMALCALAFMLVPVVNVLTTTRHLGRSLLVGDWVMAGVDLSCIVVGLLLAWVARRCAGKKRAQANPSVAARAKALFAERRR